MAEIKIDITKSVEAMCKAFKADGYFVGKWIPCSERLPDICEPVLVTMKMQIGGRFIATARRNEEEMWESAWDGDIIDCKATHWMPLPEPPKEGADDGT